MRAHDAYVITPIMRWPATALRSRTLASVYAHTREKHVKQLEQTVYRHILACWSLLFTSTKKIEGFFYCPYLLKTVLRRF